MACCMYHSPIGPLYLESSGTALVKLSFSGPEKEERDPVLQYTCGWLDRYFQGHREPFAMPLTPEGTAFQKAVWAAMGAIPYGQTSTYGAIAAAIGKPGAARAVGGACNRNPIAILQPCHRVTGAAGLTGYAGGLDKKQFLLELESSGLVCGPLTRAAMESICAWRYPAPYDGYDLPPYEELLARGRGFTDPRKAGNYRGFWQGDTLVGYVNMMPRETEVFIGIGLAPAWCGMGYGTKILRRTCGLARVLHPGKFLALQVRTWNSRAVRCYQKAGFQIEGQPYEQTTGGGTGTFCRMVLK